MFVNVKAKYIPISKKSLQESERQSTFESCWSHMSLAMACRTPLKIDVHLSACLHEMRIGTHLSGGIDLNLQVFQASKFSNLFHHGG